MTSEVQPGLCATLWGPWVRRQIACPLILTAGLFCSVVRGVHSEPSAGKVPGATAQKVGLGNTGPSVNSVAESGPAINHRYRCTSKPAEFKSGLSLLKGTIFIPDGISDLPGVVLLGGSERGPRTHRKNQLAEHLAGAGIAALTYDSAGTGESTGNALLQARGDRAEEACAAARYLKNQAPVAVNQVGLLGISEGAGVAMLAAARDESLAFVIPVSGAFGITMTEVSRYRIEVQGRLRGLSSEEIQQALLLEELLFALMVGPESFEWRLIEMKAAQWPNRDWDQMINIVKTVCLATSPAEQEQKLDALRKTMSLFRSKSWFDLVVVDVARFDRFMAMSASDIYAFLEKGPLAAGDFIAVHEEMEQYRRVRCPVLAVWGENDNFLPPHRSAAFLKSCLSRGGHTDVTYRIVPNAGHILTRDGDDGRFVDEFLDLLTEWLLRRFAPPAANDK